MSDEIGKIEKPSSKDIIGKRKAFICVLLQAPPEASKDLHELIQKYWEALDANITNLESSICVGRFKTAFVLAVVCWQHVTSILSAGKKFLSKVAFLDLK